MRSSPFHSATSMYSVNLGFNCPEPAALQVVVPTVEHLTEVGYFVEVARHKRILDQVVCCSTSHLGKLFQIGLGSRKMTSRKGANRHA